MLFFREHRAPVVTAIWMIALLLVAAVFAGTSASLVAGVLLLLWTAVQGWRASHFQRRHDALNG